MFMQNIRRATRKHRKLLLAVVILLCVGMVGSFATWGSNKYDNNTPWDEKTYMEKAMYYQDYIDSLGYPEDVSQLTYDQAAELGDLYQTLSSLAKSAFDEESAAGYDTISNEALASAAKYLTRAAELAEDKSDTEMQSMWENIASIHTTLGDSDSATAAYKKAAGFAEAALNVDGLSEQEKAEAYVSVGDLFSSGADTENANRLYGQAITSYRTALEQAETAADKANVWTTIAGLYQKCGDAEGRANSYEEAIACYESTITEDMSKSEVASVWTTIADL